MNDLNSAWPSDVESSSRHVRDELQNKVLQRIHRLRVRVGVVAVPE